MKANEIKIDREFQNLIPPLTHSEEAQLEENILAEGIRESLITWNGILVDGHHRRDIAQRHDLNFEVTEKVFSDRNEAILWIIRNQFGRRNLHLIDRSALGLRMETVLKEKAKDNLILAGKLYGENHPQEGSANSPKALTKIDVREEVASAINMGSNTYSKAKRVLAESTPQQIEEIRNGDASIHSRWKEIDEAAQKKQREIEEAAKETERVANEIKKAREFGEDEDKRQAYLEEKRQERASLEVKAQDDLFKNQAAMFQLKAITNLQQITDDNPYLNEVMDQIIAWCEKNKTN